MADQALRTPVALLIFNRPDATAKVFAAVRAARPSRLLVVADGPRAGRPDEAALCTAARAVLDGVDWTCEVTTNFAEANLGCRGRVSSGLDWVFGQVEEAIILEDDCLPHPDFFPFCQALLERYRDDQRVMMISGTNALGRAVISESYLFSRYFAIWGWATWRRAWRQYDIGLAGWAREKARSSLRSCYPAFVARYFTQAFDAVASGRLDTWDYQWVYACIFNSGLSITPRVNLVSNIGTEGTHTIEGLGEESKPSMSLGGGELIHPRHVHPDHGFDEAVFEARLRIWPWERAQRKALTTWHRLQAGNVCQG
jgi:hypothetical protein